jgi:hypothetical protein
VGEFFGKDCKLPPYGLPKKITYTNNSGSTETLNLCYNEDGYISKIFSKDSNTIVNLSSRGELYSILISAKNDSQFSYCEYTSGFRVPLRIRQNLRYQPIRDIEFAIDWQNVFIGLSRSNPRTNEYFNYASRNTMPDSSFLRNANWPRNIYNKYAYQYDNQNRFITKRIIRGNNKFIDLSVAYDNIYITPWPDALVLALTDPFEYSKPLRFVNFSNLDGAFPFDFMKFDNGITEIKDYNNTSVVTDCQVYTTKFLDKKTDNAGNLTGFRFLYTFIDCNTTEVVLKDVVVSITY